jgi:hypothetical protein
VPGTAEARTRRGPPDLAIAAIVVCWITLILCLDRVSSLGDQRWLGVGTWLLLAALLWRESRRTRLQVAVVVVFATAVELTFAGWLGVYVYRLPGVPWFVPPGHGLVYLAALAIGRSNAVQSRRRMLTVGTAVLVTGYAGWGLLISGRFDELGAFWALCLLAALQWSRQPTVFVGAFLVVTYLELLGTHLGTWTWSVRDPIAHLVAMGNPPSGAAGGYGFFDLAALWVSDRLVREDPQDLVVQPAVGADDTAEAWVSAA